MLEFEDTKLQQLTERLWSERDIYVVGPYSSSQKKRYRFPDREVLVAPRQPVASLKSLHQFEQQLVDLLKPDQYQPAIKISNSSVFLGRLSTTGTGIFYPASLFQFKLASKNEVFVYPSQDILDLSLICRFVVAGLLYERDSDTSYLPLTKDQKTQVEFFTNGLHVISTGLLENRIIPEDIIARMGVRFGIFINRILR